MSSPLLIRAEGLSHDYRGRSALKDVHFQVERGEIFGVLGPNGSGKSTLFRILSTFFPPSQGSVTIGSWNIVRDYMAVRRIIGVVFQSPSLDAKLTVHENLIHQGRLYGLRSSELKSRVSEMLNRFGLVDRSGDLTETLSGGLKRRVELAKGLLHKPELLILDEPSTGLDPGARLDMWSYLKNLNESQGVTILVTTHWMEEAERCGRLLILNHGLTVAQGMPVELKREIGGDVLVIKMLNGSNPQQFSEEVKSRFGAHAYVSDSTVHIEHPKAHEFLTRLVEAFPGVMESITVRKPSLEDVFIHRTGHRFWEEN